MVVAVAAHHPVVVRGAEVHHAVAGPVLLERTDDDFLAATLAELQGAPGVPTSSDVRIASTHDSQGVLRLQQPVHRTFYIALFEIACDVYGQPRLDPDRILSAGLVVRRVGRPLGDGTEGWRQGGNALKGWLPFYSAAEEQYDPDPTQRVATLSAGHPEIDRKLALNFPGNALREAFSPLFVASPDICEATGRTLLYGVVPLASSEQSQAPAQLPAYDDDAVAEIAAGLPRLFTANGSRYVPFAGQTLDASYATQQSMLEFVTMLRQIAVEFDAFGTTTEATQLHDAMNTILVDFPGVQQRPAADWLKEAIAVLVDGDTTRTVEMPTTQWPDISADFETNTFLPLVLNALRARLNVVSPHEGRFEDLNSAYIVRGFVRVKDEDGDCSPFIVWSDNSEPFHITPWYAAGNAPPVKIVLPDASDKNFLKNIKPNVAFVIPPGLFSKLQQPPTSWLQGGVKGNASGSGLGWICSFSIPIITLCAFIVLYIFLSLFDLIFQWMLWVKICIPFPVRKPRP